MIDENLREEMRVTVIATGFGKTEEMEERIPESRPVSSEPEKTVVPLHRQEISRDLPTFLLQAKGIEAKEKSAPPTRARMGAQWGEDEYDIPTFLRKQAD